MRHRRGPSPPEIARHAVGRAVVRLRAQAPQALVVQILSCDSGTCTRRTSCLPMNAPAGMRPAWAKDMVACSLR